MSSSELFHVCIHEAAHLIVARHYGSDGWAEVFSVSADLEVPRGASAAEAVAAVRRAQP